MNDRIVTIVMSVIIVLGSILVAPGCVSSRRIPITLLAVRVDETMIHLSICSGRSDTISIPLFTHTAITDSMNVTVGDTLHILFRNSRVSDNGVFVSGGGPQASYEEGDRCLLNRIITDSCITTALIDGQNTNVRFVSMRLSGVTERITLSLGKPQVVYSRGSIDMFTGGFAK